MDDDDVFDDIFGEGEMERYRRQTIFYILGGEDGHTPIPLNKEAMNDVLVWGKMFESRTRIVAQDQVRKGVRVSTVFLGLDHNFYGVGPPLLFETMIFGGKHDQYQRRCATWDEALIEHEIALDKAGMGFFRSLLLVWTRWFNSLFNSKP